MILLAIEWDVVGIKTLQFILSFSILVTLHELGHYVAARVFGCKVDKFYLFFDPWFSLFSMKKINGKWQYKFLSKNQPDSKEVIVDGKKKQVPIDIDTLPDGDWRKEVNNTKYGIGWLPMGGYVKIAGMIDESMDKEQLKKPAQSWEFRSKPAWQRLIIMLAGVIVNVLLGFFIYAMMLWHWGEEYLPTQALKYGISADSIAQSIGFKDGDKIVNVDGKEIIRFKDVTKRLLLYKTNYVTVERNGQLAQIAVPADITKTLIKHKNLNFIAPRVPMSSLALVVDTLPAGKAGLKKGDKIVAANGILFTFTDEAKTFFSQHKDELVQLSVLRNTDTVHMPLKISDQGTIGVVFDVASSEKIFDVVKKEYSFFESIPAGVEKTKETLQDYWLQLKLIFGGKVAAKDSVGGLISIGNIFPAVWDWQAFWALTAFFSIVLAFMNILPIPALDGGHALFCVAEMITGRKPSEKFMEVAQTVGMILLLGLMVFALGNDILRLFSK